MANVEFHDFSIDVYEAINEKSIAFLYEIGAEVETAVKRNTKVKTTHTKESWKCVVDEAKLEAHIGNPLQNAIWEEFGTGEYAVNGDGRKGYWVYVVGSDGSSSRTGKSYSLKEAKKVMAILRSKGLEAYYTSGKKPRHALQRALDSKQNVIINRARQIFGEL